MPARRARTEISSRIGSLPSWMVRSSTPGGSVVRISSSVARTRRATSRTFVPGLPFERRLHRRPPVEPGQRARIFPGVHDTTDVSQGTRSSSPGHDDVPGRRGSRFRPADAHGNAPAIVAQGAQRPLAADAIERLPGLGHRDLAPLDGSAVEVEAKLAPAPPVRRRPRYSRDSREPRQHPVVENLAQSLRRAVPVQLDEKEVAGVHLLGQPAVDLGRVHIRGQLIAHRGEPLPEHDLGHVHSRVPLELDVGPSPSPLR